MKNLVAISILILCSTMLLTCASEHNAIVGGKITLASGATADSICVGLYQDLDSDPWLDEPIYYTTTQDGSFKFEVEPGIYQIGAWTFGFESGRKILLVPDNKSNVNVEMQLYRKGTLADFDSVRIVGEYCDWKEDKAKMMVKSGDVWTIKNPWDFMKKGSLYKFIIDDVWCCDLRQPNAKNIRGLTAYRNYYDGEEILFDPSLYIQPPPKADVTVMGSDFNEEFITLRSELQDHEKKIREQRSTFGSLSQTQIDSIYIENKSKYEDFIEKYPPILESYILEQSSLSLSYSHPTMIKMRNIWRDSNGDENKLNEFYQSDEFVTYVKDNIEMMKRFDSKSYLLDGYFSHYLTFFDDIINKSDSLHTILQINKNYFSNYLLEFAESTNNKECGGNIIYIVASNYARNEDDTAKSKAEELLLSLKKNYPDNYMVKRGVVDKTLQSLKISVGSIAKDFSIVSLTGDSYTLSEMRGKFIMLDFWGSWCGPCRGEIPNFIKLYNSFPREELMVLGLANDDSTKLCNYIKSEKIPYPNTLASEKLLNQYGITKYPTTFLIDPEGKIAAIDLRGENIVDLVKEKINEYKNNM